MKQASSPTNAELACGPFPEIGGYAVIGDCRTAALISKTGCVEWLCWPRFDSESIFAAMLDRERGGFWKVSPLGNYSVSRSYVKDSNVLQTTFSSPSGKAELTDLMPVRDAAQCSMVPDHEIVRRLTCTEGELEVEVCLVPRATYGEAEVKMCNQGKLGLRMTDGKGVYWLRSNIPLKVTDRCAFARKKIQAGETLLFSFSYSQSSPAVLTPLEHIPERIETCIKWWQDWAAQGEYKGQFREEVIRSALALKLMIFAPSGAIVAAPTTSLPERIGGDLNWDYRFCWLRDASLTIRALLELGYWKEATGFLDWMLHATRLTQPELRIMYTVFGNPPPRERESEVLRGYKGSHPVRIGNGARDQLQLDVYGEVIDAAAQYAFHGGRLDSEMQKVLVDLGKYVSKHWDVPDNGIWEPRTPPRDHTHSRLLCWTALDRLVSLATKGKLQRAPVDEFKKQAEAIRVQIQKRAWNDALQSYVSELDGHEMDSSLLLLSWYGFEKPESPRMRTTYRRLRERLSTPEGLLYRSEQLPPEGTFAICSFWEAEYLALGGGTIEDTCKLMTSLMQYRNDVGLYGEEIDAKTGQALGNFPQAFTHVGFIGAALSLEQREKGEQQLGHRPESATVQKTHQTQAA
ncbi:MAG TPA: glycoside hydrolase family 15 protein [Terriglobales bacterium]|nr:glycoside hydrolase family 15 protein [Terriglobales bacterium]